MRVLRGPTSSRMTQLLGWAAIAVLAATGWLGLVVTGPDRVQGELVRLIYIHPALAWTTYVAFAITAAASALWLFARTRSRFWDLLAGASAEVGVVFCALTLVTGAIWGRPTWGVWWTWDARLTSTALLLMLFLGYLALRRLGGDPEVRARRSAIAALIAVLDVPLVHLSVDWWRTLHQGRTLLRPDPTIEGTQLATMLLGIAGFTLLLSWLVVHRFRLERLVDRADRRDFAAAVAERRGARGSTGSSVHTPPVTA